MRNCKYTMDTIPDPVVGGGFYIFPVLQSFGGNATRGEPGSDCHHRSLDSPNSSST